MRWFDTTPEHRSIRTREAFLWLPKKLDGQTRWLEFAVWEEWYCASGDNEGWYPSRWL